MFRDSIVSAAASLRVGGGLQPDVQMGPVISRQSQERIESLVETGARQGGKVILDGRKPSIAKHENGSFVKPTVIDALPAGSDLFDTEIFGPVLSLVHAKDLDEALSFLSRS